MIDLERLTIYYPIRYGRGDRCHAGCGRIWLQHSASDHDGLHNDAQVSPEHLPRRHRHTGPRAQEEVRGEARTCCQLFIHAG